MGAALVGANSPISRIGIAAGVWVCPQARRDLAGCSPAMFQPGEGRCTAVARHKHDILPAS